MPSMSFSKVMTRGCRCILNAQKAQLGTRASARPATGASRCRRLPETQKTAVPSPSKLFPSNVARASAPSPRGSGRHIARGSAACQLLRAHRCIRGDEPSAQRRLGFDDHDRGSNKTQARPDHDHDSNKTQARSDHDHDYHCRADDNDINKYDDHDRSAHDLLHINEHNDHDDAPNWLVLGASNRKPRVGLGDRSPAVQWE